MDVAIAFGVVFVLVIGSELWWRSHRVHNEISRKFVHITVGSFVAFWPYWLTSTDIKLFSLAFVVVILASRYLHVFQAIHAVQRPTSGELWFALTVGILAFMHNHPHIYTAALLEMALADGLAAVVGTRYGNSRRYTIFGAPKTAIGTFTFFIVSVVILYYYVVAVSISAIWILPIALVATILENLMVRGLDNLVVPLATAGMLLLIH